MRILQKIMAPFVFIVCLILDFQGASQGAEYTDQSIAKHDVYSSNVMTGQYAPVSLEKSNGGYQNHIKIEEIEATTDYKNQNKIKNKYGFCCGRTMFMCHFGFEEVGESDCFRFDLCGSCTILNGACGTALFIGSMISGCSPFYWGSLGALLALDSYFLIATQCVYSGAKGLGFYEFTESYKQGMRCLPEDVGSCTYLGCGPNTKYFIQTAKRSIGEDIKNSFASCLSSCCGKRSQYNALS